MLSVPCSALLSPSPWFLCFFQPGDRNPACWTRAVKRGWISHTINNIYIYMYVYFFFGGGGWFANKCLIKNSEHVMYILSRIQRKWWVPLLSINGRSTWHQHSIFSNIYSRAKNAQGPLPKYVLMFSKNSNSHGFWQVFYTPTGK